MYSGGCLSNLMLLIEDSIFNSKYHLYLHRILFSKRMFIETFSKAGTTTETQVFTYLTANVQQMMIDRHKMGISFWERNKAHGLF